MEVLFLVVVYIIYGFHSVRAFYNNLLLLGGLILSISWIVAPFLFDSSPFDLDRNLEDWEDWNNWRNVPVEDGVGAAEGGGAAAAEGGGVAAAEGGVVAAAEGGVVAAAEGGVVAAAEGGVVAAAEGGVAAVEEGLAVEETVPVEEKSWEAWWNKELDHIRTPTGRITETILSLRFFIFPLVVGYKLDVQGLKNSLSNCVIPWICVVVILFLYEVICKKPVIKFFSINRVATIGALAIAYYYSAFGDMHAFIIAIITTVWGFISFFSNNGVATIGALAVAYYCSTHEVLYKKPVIRFFSNKKPEIDFFSYNQLATIGALAIACYYSAFGDMLAFFIAIITTVWGFLSICVAWKPTLKRFSLWTPVTYLAWICDTGMGALMFKIANMFSQRSIKQYLVRNMFDQNICELLHNSSTELKMQSTTWVGDPTTARGGPSDKKTHVEGPLQAQKLLTPTSSSISTSSDELPKTYQDYIVDVDEVAGDGNCGFQAVAVGLHRLNAVGLDHLNADERDPVNKYEWINIRRGLLQELENPEKNYRDKFGERDYASVKDRLDFCITGQVAPEDLSKIEAAPEAKWMQMPEIGVLIATHFKVILHVFGNLECQTYLPLSSPPPTWDKLKFISLGHDVKRKHFVHLLLKEGYPVPTVVEYCIESEWKRPYEEWINKRGPSKWMTLYRKWFKKCIFS